MTKTYCARNFLRGVDVHKCTGGRYCKGGCKPAATVAVSAATAATRRLVITPIADGFRVETEWQNRIGYWSTLSTTITATFPLHIVGSVAERPDYDIFVKAGAQ